MSTSVFPGSSSKYRGTTPKANFFVLSTNNLPTSSVTIYRDQRAAIVREVPSLDLKPGRNEIVIRNVTPHLLKESFRVSGQATTAGSLTDLSMDLVACNNSSLHNPDDDSSSEDDVELSPEAKDVGETIASLKAGKSLLVERIEINRAQRALLQTRSERGQQDVDEVLSTYAKTRESLFREHTKFQQELEGCERKLATFERKQRNLQRAEERTMSPQIAARRLRKEEREKRKTEQTSPWKVYNIKIVIECSADVDEEEDESAPIATTNPGKPETTSKLKGLDDRNEPSLKLSYITTGASWTPKHDLRLDTTEESGVLTYRAQYFNNTGENWNDSVVTLSTNRNTFRGVDDKVPKMPPWNIGLEPKGQNNSGESLYSPSEKGIRGEEKYKKAMRDNRVLSGLGPIISHSLESEVRQPSMAARGFRRRPVATFPLTKTDKKDPYDSDSSSSSDDTLSTSNRLPKKLRLATTSSGSHGTTTTYELPGKRTIPSSSLERQHVITEFPLSSLGFYHVAAPKLREAVFLNAWIINTSSTYLLKGSAGLTVDGSYLGVSSVPRCAPGDKFTISLGVDEDIRIRYSKPVQKLSSQAGFMGLSSEHVQRYIRRFHVQNTSLNPRPVSLLVIDQVPVSSDERLKLTIVNPPGLKNEGDKMAVDFAGRAGHEPPKSHGGKQESSVGTVELKRDGEISWQLELSTGKKMEVVLEYEARMPDTEIIASS